MVFGSQTRKRLLFGEDDDESESSIRFSGSSMEDLFPNLPIVDAFGDDDDGSKTSSVEKSLVRKRKGPKRKHATSEPASLQGSDVSQKLEDRFDENPNKKSKLKQEPSKKSEKVLSNEPFTSNNTRKKLRQKKPVTYAEPETDSEWEETRFSSSFNDGKFDSSELLSETGSGKKERMVAAVTKREKEEDKEQLATAIQKQKEVFALKKPSQLERFRAREKAELAQEQQREEKKESAQLQLLEQKQSRTEEEERENAQALKRKRKKAEREENQRAVEEEPKQKRVAEKEQKKKRLAEKKEEKKQNAKEKKRVEGSKFVSDLPDDLEEDFMAKLSLLSASLQDISKKVFRQTQLATESYVQNFPSFRSTLEPKLKEEENILEQKIQVKVDASVTRIKDIVNQKLTLIRALKSGRNVADEEV